MMEVSEIVREVVLENGKLTCINEQVESYRYAYYLRDENGTEKIKYDGEGVRVTFAKRLVAGSYEVSFFYEDAMKNRTTCVVGVDVFFDGKIKVLDSTRSYRRIPRYKIEREFFLMKEAKKNRIGYPGKNMDIFAIKLSDLLSVESINGYLVCALDEYSSELYTSVINSVNLNFITRFIEELLDICPYSIKALTFLDLDNKKGISKLASLCRKEGVKYDNGFLHENDIANDAREYIVDFFNMNHVDSEQGMNDSIIRLTNQFNVLRCSKDREYNPHKIIYNYFS